MMTVSNESERRDAPPEGAGDPWESMMDRDRGDERSGGMRRRWTVYVERSSHQWVVLDPDGNFWILPAGDEPWINRRPFEPTEETGLDPIPGHYKHVLGLPA